MRWSLILWSCFEGSFLFWLLMVIVLFYFWNIMIMEMKENRSVPVRVALMCLFGLFSAIELLFFLQSLRETPFTRFSWAMGVIVPSILFWGNTVGFVVSLARAIKKYGSGRNKFTAMRGMRVLLKILWCLPIAELSFALAYSSWFGVVMSILRGAEVAHHNYIFFTPRRRRTAPGAQRLRTA